MGTASMTTGQFREFAGAVIRSLPEDLDPSIAQGWIENQKSLRKILREALMPIGIKRATSIFPISVDYGISVEDAVQLGCYFSIHTDINSFHFPKKHMGKIDVTVELFHFNRDISTDEVLSELKKTGFRPADLHELLALGEKYPDVQYDFPIVALDAVWEDRYGFRCVPCLDQNESRRSLSLYHSYIEWPRLYRFAAVRK